MPRDVADRPDRRAADLADPLGDRIGHREDLVGLFVEQQVVVAKMRSAHVPVEVLRLQVEREDVRQQRSERAADLDHGVLPKIGRDLACVSVLGACDFLSGHGSASIDTSIAVTAGAGADTRRKTCRQSIERTPVYRL